ncbi:MAG: DUF2264 domain-containing protein [Pseudomonadota bacterium]|nr:DUF2264 domain-containing protein [Pseudomonadota bacterium]
MTVARLKLSVKRFYDAQVYKSKIPTFPRDKDLKLQSTYCSDQAFEDRVGHLITYFVDSWVRSTSLDCTRAYFKGAFSYNDRDIDAIEGTTRFLPFIASVLMNPNFNVPSIEKEKGRSLEDMFISAIVNGTDPLSKGYWGQVEDYSQLICEGADVALALWIARDRVMERLSKLQKQNLFDWLRQCTLKKIVDNNWHLFRQTILLILSKLSEGEDSDSSSYDRIKSFYVGDGWFSDGVGKNFDFYNAWAFHYSLFWFTEIDKDFDKEFISTANFKFCQSYQKLFTLNGFPMFGRSHCYRTAATSPLIASILLNNHSVEAGTAKRIFDQLWKFIIANGGIANGVPTQGYLKQDLRFLDEYSGPGSSLWGLRSLILLLQGETYKEFSQTIDNSLSVEVSDFRENIESIGLIVTGNKEQGTVEVEWSDREFISVFIERYRFWDKLKEFLSQRPQRPKNDIFKNKLKTYSSKTLSVKDEN